jgi:hypothetical protein
MTSLELLPYVYPRWSKPTWGEKHFVSVRRGAAKYAYVIRRLGRRGKPVWALKEWD